MTYQRQSTADNKRSADALGDTSDEKHSLVLRKSAKYGGPKERGVTHEHGAAAAVPVGQDTCRHQEHRKGQAVGVHHPGKTANIQVHCLLYLRHHHDDRGYIECGHEYSDADHYDWGQFYWRCRSLAAAVGGLDGHGSTFLWGNCKIGV